MVSVVTRVETRHEDQARLHGALAEPVRVAIAEELAWSDRTPSELRQYFGLESNLLAHHLDVLEGAGLVERAVSHGDRRRRYVRLRPEKLAELVAPRVLIAAGVVFVCTRNSARSQLAAALWREASDLPATSAGTEPAERVHPEAIRAGARRGLDLAGAVPCCFEPDEATGKLVVTVCDLAHESLGPVEASTDRPVLHWSISDPAESGKPEAFDTALESIAARVGALAGAVRSP